MLRYLCLSFALSLGGMLADAPATAPCSSYPGWSRQVNPRTDATGYTNSAYPEAGSTTYWVARFQAATSSLLTIHGQYPISRFMSLQIDSAHSVLDFLIDINIAPDPGQNNPFLSGTDNGTFTAYVVFAPRPPLPAPNTMYAGTETDITLAYRVYHTTDPEDPVGSAVNPPIPELWMDPDACPLAGMGRPQPHVRCHLRCLPQTLGHRYTGSLLQLADVPANPR